VEYDGDITWIAGKAEWASRFVWMPRPTPAEVDAIDPASLAPSAHYYAYAWTDEASGAAAVAVTTHLERDLDITQGRGSRLFTQQASDGYVRVGGRTVFDRTIRL